MSRTFACSLGLLVASVALAPSAVRGQDAAAMEKVTYDDHVRPIFREHCFSCHNQDKAQSDLVIDTFPAMMRGGASGQVVVPGDPDNSRLWLLVSHLDTPEMPPEQDKLPEEKLAVLKAWIAGGALENSGSTANIKKKPAIDLAATSGSARPEGPPPMPEGLSRQPVLYTPRAAAVTALAASPWAPLAAVAGQQQISLYNTDTGELLGVLPFPEGIPYVLKFSRSGTLLLAGGGHSSQRGLVVVFDVRTGARVFEIGDELDAVLTADINEDHSKIALGGPSKVVRVYSTADGALLYEVRKHTDWIYALEFSPDGVLLATADRNGGMFVWECETGREYQNLKGHGGAINDVSWRTDSNVLASCSEDGTVRLWEMNGGSQIAGWGAHGGGATAVDYAADGRIVSMGRDRQAKLWDGNGGQQRAFDAMADLGLEVAVTHDVGRVIAGDWTGDVKMWNAADGLLVGPLAANPPTLEMTAQAATARAAETAQLHAAAAAELAALQQAAADKAVAAVAAVEKFATSQAEADKAEADRLTAEQAEADRLVAEKTAAVAPLAEAATAAQQAAAAADQAVQQAAAAAAAAGNTQASAAP